MSFSIQNLFDVAGTVAVVTGGGSGIGLQIAKALEQNGATVYILGRRLPTLEAAAKESAHGNIVPIQCDVTSKDDLRRATALIAEKSGHVNFLACNSGIMPAKVNEPPAGAADDIKLLQEYLMDSSADEWSRAFSINSTSAFYTTVAFLELLDKGNKLRAAEGLGKPTSQVLITGSIAGFLRTMPFAFAYSVSKAAVHHLSKMFATYFASYKIRVNVLSPGIFPSEMTTGAPDVAAKLAEVARTAIPLGRIGDNAEIAGTALYLASRAGGYCNGLAVVIDGGRVSILPAVY
ncbi:uncharacterized protein V1510DRAFT_417006 [Dipodascopsis tothii]|uniref:uncharacterized protein n=1 Tax=Dipodascopsis tothii TaxID=44089 RepID=UPI0034CF9E81